MSGLLNSKCILKGFFLIAFLSYCFPSQIKFIVCLKAPARTVNGICESSLWRLHINVCKYGLFSSWYSMNGGQVSVLQHGQTKNSFLVAIMLILMRACSDLGLLILDIGMVLLFPLVLTTAQTTACDQSFSAVLKGNFRHKYFRWNGCYKAWMTNKRLLVQLSLLKLM